MPIQSVMEVAVFRRFHHQGAKLQQLLGAHIFQHRFREEERQPFADIGRIITLNVVERIVDDPTDSGVVAVFRIALQILQSLDAVVAFAIAVGAVGEVVAQSAGRIAISESHDGGDTVLVLQGDMGVVEVVSVVKGEAQTPQQVVASEELSVQLAAGTIPIGTDGVGSRCEGDAILGDDGGREARVRIGGHRGGQGAVDIDDKVGLAVGVGDRSGSTGLGGKAHRSQQHSGGQEQSDQGRELTQQFVILHCSYLISYKI